MNNVDFSQPEWLIIQLQEELLEITDPVRQDEIKREIEVMRTHPWPP